jgi:hypothetical protein
MKKHTYIAHLMGAFIFTLMLFAVPLSIMAASGEEEHEEANVIKAQQGDWGVVLNLSGLINNIRLTNFQDSIGNNSILIKHYRKENLVYRFGLGAGLYSVKTSSEDSLKLNQQLLDKDSIFKQSSFSVSFGMEKHLGTSKRLDPYVGFQAMVGFIGKTKIEVDSETRSKAGTASIDRDIVMDGGNAFGLHLIAGFNYFIAERFSLGAEYTLGYNYRLVGGNFSDTVIDTPLNGTGNSTVEKGQLAVRNSGFSPSGSANIFIAYYFGRSN